MSSRCTAQKKAPGGHGPDKRKATILTVLSHKPLPTIFLLLSAFSQIFPLPLNVSALSVLPPKLSSQQAMRTSSYPHLSPTMPYLCPRSYNSQNGQAISSGNNYSMWSLNNLKCLLSEKHILTWKSYLISFHLQSISASRKYCPTRFND